MHTETAFSLVVHLPYAEAAPLFGSEASARGGETLGSAIYLPEACT